MATIAENIHTLQTIKSDIKDAILSKGGSVTDAFGGYAQAIMDLPSGGGRDEELEAQLIDGTISGEYSNRYLTSIKERLFSSNQRLTSVNFPNLTCISSYAFYYASKLETAILPKVESIGYGAFQGTRIAEADFPQCTSIGALTFSRNSYLKSVNVPKLSIVPYSCFYSCDNIETLLLSDKVAIAPDNFYSCTKLQYFSVPAQLVVLSTTALPTSIYNAMSDAHKGDLTAHPSFSTSTLISDEFLYGLNSTNYNGNIEEVNLPQCWYLGDYCFNSPKLTVANLPKVEYVGVNCFAKCSSMTSYDLPNLSYISDGAFWSNYLLTSINAPNVSYIGSHAFSQCSKLETIDFPNVEYISNRAFFYCSSLKSVNLPKASYISSDAFSNALNNVNFFSAPLVSSFLNRFNKAESVNLHNISQVTNQFSNISYLTTVDVHNAKILYSSAFYNCTNLTSIDCEMVEEIKASAFYGCNKLTSISLPNLISLSSAFQYCYALQSINLPKVESIPYATFSSCTSLSLVTLGVASSIADQAFYNCRSLRRIELMASSVCQLASRMAFYGTSISSNMGSIIVPTSLVDAYKTNTVWSFYKSRIFGI